MMELEQLLPLVARLTEKYTSKDSTSVTYEVGNMLMEAVIYTINECFLEEDTAVSAEKIDADAVYKKGYDIILKKVYEAKEIYEGLIENFQDYGCKNYKDTIIKGMPKFFVKYDAKFSPQNHLLMLDYPMLSPREDLCGIDLILEYLKAIRLEAEFMSYFDVATIRNLLRSISPEYQSLYFDNICYPVLWNAIGCAIVDKPLSKLKLDAQDEKEIRDFFRGDSLDQIENRIRGILRMLTKHMKSEDAFIYFEKIARDYAARLLNGEEYVL